MNKKKLIIILAFAVLILTNIITLTIYLKSKNQPMPCQENKQFELLSPTIAWKELDDFLDYREDLKISYNRMKEPVLSALNNTNGHYGIYFEDLTTGAWMGINEKDEFQPISLIKLPLLVAVLKKVERGELDLEKNVTLKKEFLDPRFGTLYQKGESYVITVKEMLIYLINESDNTAFYALISETSEAEFETARTAMGLPDIKPPEKISPKDYANMLRSLYLSTYLRRTFSEVALSLMVNTNFNSALPSGVPKSVKVAHKVGIATGYFHDCGIVYDNNPYILCVMSVNSTQEEANRVISNISKIIYEYKHGK